MKQQEIVTILKEQYDRSLRKQIVKSIIESEKDSKLDNQTYHIINQIFSYVLQSLNWNIANNSDGWDSTPLYVMSQTFPKIETTQWYQQQKLASGRSIDVVLAEK